MVLATLLLLEKIAECEFQYDQIYNVIVTKVHDPNFLFVRPVTITEDDFHFLEVPGKRMPEEEIVQDKIVIYFSEEADKYVRGRIFEIDRNKDGGKCSLHAIDYGYLDINVSFSNLFQPKLNKNIKPLATKCTIANCFPYDKPSWKSDIIKIVEKLMRGPYMKLYVRILRNENMHVDFYTKHGNVNVGKWMVKQRFASPIIFGGFVREPQRICQPNQCKIINLNDGEVLKVRVRYVKSAEEFYVAKTVDYKEYLKKRRKFTKYCEKQKYITKDQVFVNRMVGYRSYGDKYYERAWIIEIKEDGKKAIIQLLDWGEKKQVFHNELKKIDYETIKGQTPAIVRFCSMEKKGRIEPRLYTGSVCIISVKDAGEDLDVPSDVIIH